MWHFRGTPPYLTARGRQIAMTDVLVARARHNDEIHRVSILLGQLCERYHRARKEDGHPVFSAFELTQVEATLGLAEQECAKLHALAGAAADMIDESRDAHGLPPSERPYAVLSDNDTTADVRQTNHV
jgi:hypothetical protein